MVLDDTTRARLVIRAMPSRERVGELAQEFRAVFPYRWEVTEAKDVKIQLGHPKHRVFGLSHVGGEPPGRQAKFPPFIFQGVSCYQQALGGEVQADASWSMPWGMNYLHSTQNAQLTSLPQQDVYFNRWWPQQRV